MGIIRSVVILIVSLVVVRLVVDCKQMSDGPEVLFPLERRNSIGDDEPYEDCRWSKNILVELFCRTLFAEQFRDNQEESPASSSKLALSRIPRSTKFSSLVTLIDGVKYHGNSRKNQLDPALEQSNARLLMMNFPVEFHPMRGKREDTQVI